jgi:predicted TPR repeat methyltransferase
MSRKKRKKKSRRGTRINKGSVPAAFNAALEAHKKEHYDEAESLYRRILRTDRNHPDALHFLGVLCHNTNRSEQALKWIRQSISVSPNHADTHNNLGNVLKENDRADEALQAYRKCLELDHEHANAHNNIGIILKQKGKLEAALEYFETAVRLQPGLVHAHRNKGSVLGDLGKVDEAIDSLRIAITLDAFDESAYKQLGQLLCGVGRATEAIEIYQKWLANEPDNPIAQHMLASCSGEDMPTRASDAFVEKTFNAFAQTFDQVLKRLEYHAPELVGQAVEHEYAGEDTQLDVLDAGCGTGLCAPLLRPFARFLEGVDLSEGMIKKAKEQGGYDHLVVEELTTFLENNPQKYDLIVSADTLCYFGELEAVFQAANNALRPGGRLVFTLEKLVIPDVNEDFRLNAHGRYSHTREYVEKTFEKAGLRALRFDEDVLRKEAKRPVDGLVVTAQRP